MSDTERPRSAILPTDPFHEDDAMFTCPDCGEVMLHWQAEDHVCSVCELCAEPFGASVRGSGRDPLNHRLPCPACKGTGRGPKE